MGTLGSLWTTVKILGCITLIMMFVSFILDSFIQSVQNLLLEIAKRKAMKSIVNANEEERQQFLNFLDKVEEAQNRITHPDQKTKNEEKE